MQQRVCLWDNLKFFLITLVVVGHFADFFTGQSATFKSIYIFIYGFHMPLFIFISGLFHKNEHIFQKCFFYISVGFFQKIVFTTTNWLLGNQPKFSVLSDNGIPWFMFVLAACSLLTYLFRNQNKKFLLGAFILLACFAGYDRTLGDFLYLSRIIVFFPFYLAGTLVDKNLFMTIKKNHKPVYVIAFLIILVWFYVSFSKLNYFYPLRPLLTGRNPFTAELLPYGPLYRLLCYAISFLTGFALIILSPSKSLRWLTKMGSRTIDVYFWHWPCFLVLLHFCHISNLYSYGFYGKLCYLLIPIFLTILLSQGGIISYPLKKIKDYCYETSC